VKKVPVMIKETWSPDAAEDGSKALAPSCGSYLRLKILNKDSHSRALDADRRIGRGVAEALILVQVHISELVIALFIIKSLQGRKSGRLRSSKG